MNAEIIQSLIKDIEKYEAHISCKEEKNEKIIKRESLLEHTRLTEKYFRYIWKEKKINEMVERFCNQIKVDMSAEARKFFEEMIFGVPIFHDLGKINPEFQKRKMENNQVMYESTFKCVGGRHSVISAVLYLEYFFKRLSSLKEVIKDKTEKNFIKKFIIIHSYIIERHHSNLGTFNNFMESLQQGNGKDIIEILASGNCSVWKETFFLNEGKIKNLINRILKQNTGQLSNEKCIGIYAYVKMCYSLLVASDYYATTEFMSGIHINQIGNLDKISDWIDVYENTDLMKSIREYQKNEYPKTVEQLETEKNINRLRTELLCDAEDVLKKNIKERLFYLEAPTGSGKSNIAIDLSFQMIKDNKSLKKIYYIYPFNTLVEQNLKSLKKVFGESKEIFKDIAVVNSLTPIKLSQTAKKKEKDSKQIEEYQKALLDRQFLNYPMIVSTHVSLFDTMFGDTKESAFGFHQLLNSVIVFDEIQSYKNTIWGEIICFLKEFAYLLNMKIIIMSATLPNLDLLSMNTYSAVTLINNKKKYFSNSCFKDRVQISYELMDKENILEELEKHIESISRTRKKILIEFIKKESAYQFFNKLIENEKIICDIEYMSGDDSVMERNRILKKIEKTKDSIILVATQVLEAGVDIDMDIGYKNISKLDSEEQFLGRINRSCLRKGIVYFFKLDDGKKIYRQDIRIEKEFTLENRKMQEILARKDFCEYYRRVLKVLKRNYNDQVGEIGLEQFFLNEVQKLYWTKVKERMKLISEDNWSMLVYLSRILYDEEGNAIDGREIWNEYISLLENQTMDYSEKRVKLSIVTSKMGYFIYQIKKNDDLFYDDKIGEIVYIEDGEKYFENGKLNRRKIQGELGEFINFI